ncbi:hypothetical protein [uncultured Marinobacter sp.]|uniref:hypothetical protein n=1 Tax=uncultured Marinobacter sp. TaxID=187379 RepID=UPI0025908210|nr:hypothetical protein [uncultured Marinobacter sp.]
MALIRYLADIKSNANDEGERRLFLIEEPELFLHPQEVEHLRAALTKLSEGAYQVVFVIHFPMVVNRKSIAETRIVRKRPSAGQFQELAVAEKQHEKLNTHNIWIWP